MRRRMSDKVHLTLFLFLAAGCVTGTQNVPPAAPQTIPNEWMSVPSATRIGSVTLGEDGKVTTTPERSPARLSDGPIRIVTNGAGSTLMNGDKILTEGLGTIDSLDLSESRGEVAFSARRENGFDIALIATEGGEVHWLPTNDPADELAVQWAPRGHKISYVIRASGGDVVRTLHIPTAHQYAIPFTGATIHSLAWDPQAERYAVAYSTPESSDRVEVLEYSGEERRTVIAPERTLDVEVAPFAPGAIVLHPRDIRYDEKLPLVVWVADDFSWSDARAALLTNARVAVVVTTRPPDGELWKVAEGTAWLDSARVFVVGQAVAGQSAERPPATTIVADPALAGRYERHGNLVAAPPAVVQSFAAGYIAAQLERDRPTNGSSR
jgi:dipeptidyl aminopeptidase/acylaminoacyl peptidase